MPRVHRYPQAIGKRRRLADFGQLRRARRRRGRIGIRARVQFNHPRAAIISSLNLRPLGINKQRHADAHRVQLRHIIAHLFRLPHHIQTALGGYLGALFGHDAHIFGHHLQRVSQHFFGHRHFQIHPRFNRLPDGEHIRVFDVAAVFAQMQGNRVRAVGFRHQSRFQRAGVRCAARVAQRGNVVNVDAE